ncbi:Myoglobin, partial [Trichinella nelsoni]
LAYISGLFGQSSQNFSSLPRLAYASDTSSCDLIKEQWAKIEINNENGGELYKWFFTEKPEFATYFQLDNVNPAEIAKTERFQALGKAFLERVKKLVNVCDDETKLKSEVTILKNEHDPRNVGLDQLKQVRPILVKFLQSKTGLTDQQTSAWDEMLKKFEAAYKSL